MPIKKLPKFKNESEERKFWANYNSTDYVDWSKARRVLMPRLKSTCRKISMKLPRMLLEEIKILANKKGVPYQSLIKVFLAERIQKELMPTAK